jgi:hypothetical protein
MKNVLSHPHFWRVAGLLAADGLLFGLSHPQRVPSFILGVAFVLLVITLYQIVLGLLMIANWYGLPGRAHRRRQARLLTGVIGGLIALQSIGELGVRDILVAVPLALLAYLYISYGKSGKGKAVMSSRAQPTSLLQAE